MQVQELYLKKFRSFSERNFSFHEGANYLIAPNASGKTTLLEAIFLCICGKSPRTQYLAELIQKGQESFTVEVHFEKCGLSQQIKLEYADNRLTTYHNYTKCKSIVAVLGLMQGVYTCPNDVQLVKGAPQMRRRFLNLFLSQQDPLYVHHLVRYKRALAQRNTLLKKRIETTLGVWEEEMSLSGAYLTQKRGEALNRLEALAAPLMAEISEGKENLTLSFQSKIVPEELSMMREKYRALFQRNRKLELLRGHTLYGPHKEDWIPLIDGGALKSYGSEGQIVSFVYALKYAEWQLLKEQSGEAPLLLLDDFGFGLDSLRKQKVMKVFGREGQAIITAVSHPSETEELKNKTFAGYQV